MTKLDRTARLLQLMEMIQWQGVDNWRDLKESRALDAIPGFKDWLSDHLKYIEPDKAQEAVRLWFMEGYSDKPHTGFYINKDRGISALRAVYKKEQEEHG